MQYKKLGNQFILRMETGEDILKNLKDFCNLKGIEAAKVSGIGAVRGARISYFDMQGGVFIDNEIPGDVELLSLMGNISVMDGQAFPHLHVTLADENFKVSGGHFSAGYAGATTEIFVEVFEGRLESRYYQESGMRLLALQDN